jgi:hypothetical protein
MKMSDHILIMNIQGNIQDSSSASHNGIEVIAMRKFLPFFVLLVFASSAYGAAVYKWVDKRGVVNYTDDHTLVPHAYLGRLETEMVTETPVAGAEEGGSSVQKTPLQPKQEVKTDIYGLGEEYWRERDRPWRERLAEAQANYDVAYKKYMAKSEELSRMRFGSPTQYKMNIIELSELNGERRKYEAEIAEANEMLDKISKEAKDAKADPAWLK